jgi:hypothetical protein
MLHFFSGVYTAFFNGVYTTFLPWSEYVPYLQVQIFLVFVIECIPHLFIKRYGQQSRIIIRPDTIFVSEYITNLFEKVFILFL